MRIVFAIVLFLAVSVPVNSQSCTTPGQTPSTAFPVCGTTTFQQSNVPICYSHNLYVPGCSGGAGSANYQDKNPFWYKFTCYTSGTLGFVITPNNLGDDYDWQLYDITGRNPDAVFTDNSLVVTGNWSGSSGTTGASASGVNYIQCASVPSENAPRFSSMPALQAGHTYLLLVSHYTDSQSGYALSFGGGTAVITDPSVPGLRMAEANCGGDIVRLAIRKKIKCSSIATNGSDFFITPAVANVTASTGLACNSGFDSDSLLLQLDQFLPPGTYTLHIRNGTDGNTLLDYCDKPIPTTETVEFTVLPKIPTPLDSIAPLTCSPSALRLVFSKPILCSSIASNGSDFVINGTYPVSVSSAGGNCGGSPATTKEILVNLSSSLQSQGTFTISVQRGTDGNTILNECGEETPVGSSIDFTVMDTVNADFTYSIVYGCSQDLINFFQAGNNGINQWKWNLDDNLNSLLQNPVGTYNVFNTKNIECIVSNGFCSDTSRQSILLENFLKADFTVPEDNCPREPVPIINTSIGKISQLNWSFGDGGSGIGPSPVHVYSTPNGATTFTITLTVLDSFGCQQSTSKKIRVYPSCVLAVPNGFTPNNDGHNDFLYPLNAVKAQNLEFYIYNRWGQLMFQTNNWKKGWDGRLNGQPQPAGTYVWMLRFVDRDTQRKVFIKGTTILVR
jgi:gliding motility-associated-like protein